MNARFNPEEFVKERNEALFSLDEEKIRAYAKKYCVSLPENPKVFWGAVYKSIYNVTDAPQELKDKAKAWLEENGMSTKIKL
ncbi:MAG: hypothetical protein PUG48_10845 [Clostridia bacterium]|nr:hypothetical protein [Clostridia bacterium]